MIKNERDIRMKLSKYLSPYKQLAQKAVDHIKDLVDDED